MAASMTEPITVDSGRESVIPLSSDPWHIKIWESYIAQQKTFWMSIKFNWVEDRKNFPLLPKPVQKTLLTGVGFFTIADDLVETFVAELLQIIKLPEAKTCYGYQFMIEDVHSQTYNQAFINLVPDAKERDEIKARIRAGSAIKDMWEFVRGWISDKSKPLRLRIVALAFVEGVMFSSIFAFIDWMKYMKYNMPDLYTSNHEISRDEGMHQRTAALMHMCLRQKVTAEEFRSVVDPGLAVVYRFNDELIPAAGLDELNRDRMKLHSSHCANILGYMFNLPDLYNATGTPLSWMKERGLITKENFFEIPSANYHTVVAGIADPFAAITDF